MALLLAARRTSALPLRRAPAILRRRPTLSSARAISFWRSSPSSEDNEDPVASLFHAWASMRVQLDTNGATLQELHLGRALGSAVQSRVARAPAANLPGLLAQIEATTDDFPFEISENKPGDAITLTRSLQSEQIKTVVSMPCLDQVDCEKKKTCLSSASSSTMHLDVTVSKGDGSNIQFTCFADPDKVRICTMNMAPPTTKEDPDHDMALYRGFE